MSDSIKPEQLDQRLPYSAPSMVDYGSVRDLTQDYVVMKSLISVAATVL